MDQISLVIEILKAKKQLSALEKDILDTLNECQKYPFDMDAANRQIISNNVNHPDIFAMVTALPTTVSKPKEQITESDLQYILSQQLMFLANKEMEKMRNGK